MPRSPDKLAFAISASAQLSRTQYKRIFDHLFVTDAVSAGFALDESVEEFRRETAWNMEALGVCDFAEDDHIYSRPPYLALLPPSGLPSAVLAGARTPKLLGRISEAARKHRRSVALTVERQPAFPLLPQRYAFTGESTEALGRFASDADIPITASPVAAVLLTYCASVEEYITRLQWGPHSEPDWKRFDFDVHRSRFSSPTSGEERRLTKYAHPSLSYRKEYKLIDGARSASVERNWGRLAAFHFTGVSPFHYDAMRAEILLPVTVPLPLLHARSLVACSGFAPAIRDLGEQGLFRVYTEIPPLIASLLTEKLNIPPRSFT